MFDIHLGKNFTPTERKEGEFMLGAFQKIEGVSLDFFKKAWAGWTDDETAPKANRSDAESQSMIDAGLKYAFGDLYNK